MLEGGWYSPWRELNGYRGLGLGLGYSVITLVDVYIHYIWGLGLGLGLGIGIGIGLGLWLGLVVEEVAHQLSSHCYSNLLFDLLQATSQRENRNYQRDFAAQHCQGIRRTNNKVIIPEGTGEIQ